MSPLFPRRTTPSAQLPAGSIPEPTDHHTETYTSTGAVWGLLQAPGETERDVEGEAPVRREKCLLLDPDSPRHMPLACGYAINHLSRHSWEVDTRDWLTERRRAEIAAEDEPELSLEEALAAEWEGEGGAA